MAQTDAVADSSADITPFWRRIPKFFLYPFSPEPLLYTALLSGASLLGLFLPTFLVELGILLASLRYAFRIMEQTSLGYLTPEQHELEAKPERKNLPYKLLGVVVAWLFIIGLIANVSEMLGTVASIFVAFALPASVMALSMGNSFWKGLNPIEWLSVMSAVGKPYFALWAFLWLLLNGAPTVLGLLAPLLGSMIALPVVHFVFIYFALVMFNMMGYCLYQYHHMLGLQVKVAFERASDGSEPAVKGAPRDTTGDEIAAKLAAGDVQGATEIAVERLRTAPEDVAAHERYHKLLVMAERRDSALHHANEFLALLLRKGRADQAVRLIKECRSLKPDFVPEDAGALLGLAQAARRAGEHKFALDLVRLLEKGHPRHRDVPAAMLLSAQILAESFRKDDLAELVLKDLLQKHPNHAAAAEAGAYLKVLERLAPQRQATKKP